jgi:hypothetical protein
MTIEHNSSEHDSQERVFIDDPTLKLKRLMELEFYRNIV